MNNRIRVLNQAAPIAIAETYSNGDGPLNLIFSDVDTIAVILTNRCLAACAHCYNYSGPKGSRFLDKELIKAFVGQITEGRRRLRVGFSGGEPFLHPDLNEILLECSIAGHSVSCTTGLKGVSIAQLDNAIDNGLKKLAISWDRYHAKFVRLDDVLSAANFAAGKTEIVIQLGEVYPGEMAEKAREICCSTRDTVKVDLYPIQRVGRAEKLNLNVRALDQGKVVHTNKIISLNFDGKVYTSCSVDGFGEDDFMGMATEFIEDLDA